MNTGFLAGKRILILGLLSNRSIAYGIAKQCRAQGAELAFTYQNDRFKDRITEMAAEFGSSLVFPCDVAEDEQIDALMKSVGQHWTDGFDGLVHAIAYAPREAIAGDFLEGATRENFRMAHDISAYSLVALARAALPLMQGRNGALVTLSYLGAVRAVPNYNTMGLAGSQRPLSGPLAGAQGHPRQRHLCRPHQDPGCRRHQGLLQHPGSRRSRRPAAPQRHHRGSGQRRRLPAV